MIKYPLFFEVSANSTTGIETQVQASAHDLPPISCAVPPEFGGPGGGYSPEDLYALAVVTCFISTFKVFAVRAKLAFSGIQGEAKLTIDRNAAGVPELNKVDLTFTLTGVEDQEKAKTLLAESEKYCLVSNAIRSEKSFTYKFS